MSHYEHSVQTTVQVNLQRYVHLIILLIFFAHVFTDGQKINMKQYQQSDGTTKCVRGLVEGSDVAVFKTTVDFTGASMDWSRNVVVEVKTKTEPEIYEVPLKGQCNSEVTSVCNCESNQGDVFHVTCTFPARVRLSEAEIRGKLSNRNIIIRPKYSATRSFPPIFDSKSIKIKVNEDEARGGQCYFSMKESQPALRVCCDNAPSPCELSVYSHGNLLLKGEGCVGGGVPYEKKYRIEYRVCGKKYDVVCNTVAAPVLSTPASACGISSAIVKLMLIIWVMFHLRG